MKVYAALAYVLLIAFALWRLMPTAHPTSASGEPPNPVAVGFSLAANYGTVAIRHSNGTVVDVAQVDADEQYMNMMERLSHDDAAHPSPPYRNLEEIWSDTPRQIARRARKAVGLPASSNVGILSKLIKDLRSRTEACLSHSIGSVVISYPALVGLYEESIIDAAEYLGLQTLNAFFQHQPRQIFAAYAGHGMGMCDHGGNYDDCRNELLTLPIREVLLVECTSTALLLHVQSMRAALDIANPDVTTLAEFRDNSNGSRYPCSPPQLTMSISRALEDFYRFLDRPEKMTVIVCGDKSDDAQVLETISQTVEAFGAETEILNDHGLYIGAEGAAQLAWRAISNREATQDEDLK